MPPATTIGRGEAHAVRGGVGQVAAAFDDLLAQVAAAHAEVAAHLGAHARERLERQPLPRLE
jgi:hypothetical protein